ncbi:MAG: hypothetical protein CV045_06495 [Cyanobacteria bacterium M5B4]|nr:MAG: hypothetical protein CV045_06495 [Cyanobacteria bacterium M5B4]
MKDITFRLQDQVFTAKLGNKINKEALYGKAKTIVEKEGVVLSKGYLTPAGEVIPRSAIDYAKLDPEGTIVTEPVVEIEDVPATMFPSVFDRENELQPVAMKELIGFNVADVYPIRDVVLDEGLYRTPSFCYRKSYLTKEALLLVKNDSLSFLLVGERKATPWIGEQVIYNFFDAEEEPDTEDELDFAMI